MDEERENPKARLFVADDLARGAPIRLAPEQARYLGSVLRMSAGRRISVFNGRDGEWAAAIEELRKDRAVIRPDDRTRPQAPETGPTIVFAPIKKSRLDFVIEKCTELGAARLLPVITDRTVVARVNAERLRAQAVEAAEQCERLTVPTVEDAQSLDAVLASWDAETPLLVGDETGGGRPFSEAIGDVRRETHPGILIGPEGGFSRRELDALENHAFVLRVGLGPRILRAETAAVAALSFWQLSTGDGRRLPRHRQDG